MARPTETEDEQLLAAAGRVLMTQGPADFTLAKAARAAGVSAATLVKRFGSKEALFLRLSQRWVGSVDPLLEEVAARHDSPLERLRATALHSYHDLDHPETASTQLATLGVDLQNAELRRLLDVGWSTVRAHLTRHAREAIAAGELRNCPPPEQLARIVMAMTEGAGLAWSVAPQGSLVARVGDDLDAMLSGWTDTGTDERPNRSRR